MGRGYGNGCMLWGGEVLCDGGMHQVPCCHQHDKDWPVVHRLKPANYHDGRGQQLRGGNGLRAMFNMEDRRGNREPARKRGEGGLFRGTEGEWLQRMWKIKAWSERGGGIHGGMSAAGTNCSDRHHPVADGWAPPRRVADGWGAKKWPQKGSHHDRGKSNQAIKVTKFGRAPAKKGTPLELKPGCWRGKCKFPHGEDARDDLMHGLPYEGVTKAFISGRQLKSHAPPKRQAWVPRRPEGAGAGFNPSPWAGYAAHNCFF